mgnify:CR=1 FL=1
MAVVTRNRASASQLKVNGAPMPQDADYPAFLQEVEALRRELADSAEFVPGNAVKAALDALRGHIAFMDSDRAMHSEVQRMVGLIEHGELLMAARAAI